MNAVIYARYSSQSQDPQTIDVEIKYCKEYADKNNLNVLDEYVDEARTGRNGNRNGLKKLKTDAKNRKFQYIIIYMSDRYYRNTLEALMFEAEMKSYNITILYTNEAFLDNTKRIDPNFIYKE